MTVSVLAGVALAVALSPGMAMAAIPGRASEEAGGGACSPCYASGDSVGLSEITGNMMGIEYSVGVCDDELTVTFGEDGTERIAAQQMHGGRCNRKACGAASPDDVDGTAWPFRLEFAEGRLDAAVGMCFVPTLLGQSVRCKVRLAVEEFAPHRYRFSADRARCADRPFELTGRWRILGSFFELVRG